MGSGSLLPAALVSCPGLSLRAVPAQRALWVIWCPWLVIVRVPDSWLCNGARCVPVVFGCVGLRYTPWAQVPSNRASHLS
eukprot:4177365-Prorocentrum_lima.AAC.1